MKNKTSTWFETKVRATKVAKNGQERKITEVYVVEALSFTEAEARTIKTATEIYPSGFDVVAIKPCKFDEVFIDDKDCAASWFKVKMQFVTTNEKTGTEKKTNVHYLVNAVDFENARVNIDVIMKGTICDYQIVSISDTAYIDVIDNEI